MDIQWVQLSTSALTNTRPDHQGLRYHRLDHTAVGWLVKLPCGVFLFSLPRAVACCGSQNVRTWTPINVFHVISSRHCRSCQNAVFNICWDLMGDVAPAAQDDVGRPHFILSLGSETHVHQAKTAVNPNERNVKESPRPYLKLGWNRRSILLVRQNTWPGLGPKVAGW